MARSTGPIRARATAAISTLALALAGLAVAPEPANAFSSFALWKEHQGIVSDALACPGGVAEDNDCFEPQSLAVLVSAVQAPDLDPDLGGEDATPTQHCDNADFVDDALLTPPQSRTALTEALAERPATFSRLLMLSLYGQQYGPYRPSTRGRPARLLTYPQTELQAKTALAGCINRYVARIESARQATAGMAVATAQAQIGQPGAVGQTGLDTCPDTIAATPGDAFNGNRVGQNPNQSDGRGEYSDKCVALAQFARALHTVQDFYSHSNWVDPVTPEGRTPLSLLVPPGLGMTTPTDLFEPGVGRSPASIPDHLITGCYEGEEDGTGSVVEDCAGRVQHGSPFLPSSQVLSKDDVRFDRARGRLGRPTDLFAKARALAVTATRRQWSELSDHIETEAVAQGQTRDEARWSLCLLTHDDAVRDCPRDPLTNDAGPVTGLKGEPLSVTFGAHGGTAPYRWSTGGGFPLGLRLDAETGEVSGTPTTATVDAEGRLSPVTVRVTVTDADGSEDTVDVVVTIRPPERCANAQRCAVGYADPHLVTFDSATYDLQLVGEFVAVRSDQDDLEIQMRQHPWQSSRRIATYAAAAVRVAGHRVEVRLPGDGPSVLVDGQPVTAAGRSTLPGGGTLDGIPGAQYTITWPDGSSVVISGRYYLNVSVALADARRGHVKGLFGDDDGSTADDFTGRDGRVLPDGATQEQLYGDFAGSWRLTDAESLFTYGEGQNTGTFTDLSFPSAPGTVASLTPEQREAATRTCAAAGVTTQPYLDFCLVDIALAGDPSMAVEGRAAQLYTDPSSAACVFGFSVQDCTSTNPTVTVNFTNRGPTGGCTFRYRIEWGDGTHDDVTIQGSATIGPILLGHHTYPTPGSYEIPVTRTGGTCASTSGSFYFTLNLA